MSDEQVVSRPEPQPYTPEEMVIQLEKIRVSAERKAERQAAKVSKQAARKAAKMERRAKIWAEQAVLNAQAVADLDAHLALIERKLKEHPERTAVNVPVPGIGPVAATLARFVTGRLNAMGYDVHTKRYPCAEQPLDEHGRINWAYYQVIFS